MVAPWWQSMHAFALELHFKSYNMSCVRQPFECIWNKLRTSSLTYMADRFSDLKKNNCTASTTVHRNLIHTALWSYHFSLVSTTTLVLHTDMLHTRCFKAKYLCILRGFTVCTCFACVSTGHTQGFLRQSELTPRDAKLKNETDLLPLHESLIFL